MAKIIQFLGFASGLWKLVSRYPAVTAGISNVIIIVAAAFGLHLTAGELATTASIVAAVFGALVHAGVIPVTKAANVKAGLKPTVPNTVTVHEKESA